jgi:VWFA-related protein
MSEEALHRLRLQRHSTPGILIIGGMLVFTISVFASFILRAQELTHAVSVINVEIPVRVYRGGIFVDSLTIKDFEVFEDGKPQPIEAVYLIKKADIIREEGKKEIKPKVARRFIFLLEMTEYLPEVGKAMDYFLDNVIEPDDSFEVYTPAKSYRMKSHVFEVNPKEKVKEQLRDILRRDIITGGSEYRNLLRELRTSLANMNLQDYRLYLEQLQTLREVDQKNMVAFAENLKKQDGQKHAFLFYQQEVLPQLRPDVLLRAQMGAEASGDWQGVFDMMDLFDLFHRDVKFDVGAIQKAYSDASISVHFLFITKTRMTGSDITETNQSTETNRPSDIIMAAKSEDIYSAFNEIARATGGISTTSANAAFAFKTAVDASENYYLIYYRPRDYKADGKFHETKVKVTTGNYQVAHRAGYWAK